MVRWSTELPRLVPLAIEALSNQHDISKQILLVEDSPGLTIQYF